jgi:hypothetical protein
MTVRNPLEIFREQQTTPEFVELRRGSLPRSDGRAKPDFVRQLPDRGQLYGSPQNVQLGRAKAQRRRQIRRRQDL